MEGEIKYQITKVNAKRIVAKAKDAEKERTRKQLDEEYKKGTLFKVAKQMKRKNWDIVGGGCVKDENGEIVTDEGERMEAWRRHFEKSKVMRCHVGGGQSEVSGKFPCAVCRKGVGANSMRAVQQMGAQEV